MLKKEKLPTSYRDQSLDFMPAEDREELMLELMRQQLLFAARSTKFWHQRIDEKKFAEGPLTRQLLEELPLLDKKLLRLYPHYDFLPSGGGPYHLVRGTGGTTGAPVPVFWTTGDWRAAMDLGIRCAGAIASLSPEVIWNGYNQSHSSGPSFDDIARGLGATPVPRHFRMNEREAIEEIWRYKAKVLVITPKGGSGKGGSLEDFLSVDPDFISRLGVKGLILSSTALEAPLLQELRAQGVEAFVNFYGSTEALPTAASCPSDPLKFHISQGPNFLEVVDSGGHQVRDGERGMVVVSRIGSSPLQASSAEVKTDLDSPLAALGPQKGSQIIRYLVGDEVTYDESPCSCGRTTPRIYNVSRLLHQEDKLQGGCERWE